jgi:hypothetical protein
MAFVRASAIGPPSEQTTLITLSKMALAHVIPDAVEKTYRRGDLFEKRQRLMTAWTEYCARPSSETGRTVVSMSARQR